MTVEREIDLSVGTIAYRDTGGAGPVVVLVHGLLMDASLWDAVVEDLAPACRCLVPTLPMGAHRHAVADDADLSLRGLARLLVELLDRLDVEDVTLVGNDTGGALVQLVLTQDAARVGRAVLVSCDAFDNLPPGLTGKVVVASGRLPPMLFGAFMQQLRVRMFRRLPIAFGWMTKRGDATTVGWLAGVWHRPDIRRDTVRFLRALGAERGVLLGAAEHLGEFEKPALVIWAADDRVMPIAHGRRLARVLPDARFVEIEDSYTLVPLDQPARLAEHLLRFATHDRGTAVSVRDAKTSCRHPGRSDPAPDA